MSARELVARLEARRGEGQHTDGQHGAGHGAGSDHAAAAGLEPAHPEASSEVVRAEPNPEYGRTTDKPPEPRRFTVAGQTWIAQVAGRGTGGTGRVAQARLAAIRFSLEEEPDRVAAEVLVSGGRLDALYEDELAELLERGLRSRKGNG